jgi:hypothetical protein
MFTASVTKTFIFIKTALVLLRKALILLRRTMCFFNKTQHLNKQAQPNLSKGLYVNEII